MSCLMGSHATSIAFQVCTPLLPHIPRPLGLAQTKLKFVTLIGSSKKYGKGKSKANTSIETHSLRLHEGKQMLLVGEHLPCPAALRSP